MSVEIKNLNYIYSPNSPYQTVALKDISLTINEGDFFGIIGHTGSGKSTLISHINALSRVQTKKYKLNGIKRPINENAVLNVGGIDLMAKKPDLSLLRRKVGMVFQYPEHQLFADTVYDDVAFGPKNMKVPAAEIPALVEDAITRVGLDYAEIKDRSPFELSGGQKRRVAIAGVIAMKPELLILDEPTAGLDPRGVKEILSLIIELKATTPTIIMVSHNMDEIAACCNRVAVLAEGKVKCCLAPEELFAAKNMIKDLGLELPMVTELANKLSDCGIDVGGVLTESALVGAIEKAVGK